MQNNKKIIFLICAVFIFLFISLWPANSAPIKGDFTNDHFVSVEDFKNFISKYGTSDTEFDIVGSDSKVDINDLMKLGANYGKTSFSEIRLELVPKNIIEQDTYIADELIYNSGETITYRLIGYYADGEGTTVITDLGDWEITDPDIANYDTQGKMFANKSGLLSLKAKFHNLDTFDTLTIMDSAPVFDTGTAAAAIHLSAAIPSDTSKYYVLTTIDSKSISDTLLEINSSGTSYVILTTDETGDTPVLLGTAQKNDISVDTLSTAVNLVMLLSGLATTNPDSNYLIKEQIKSLAEIKILGDLIGDSITSTPDFNLYMIASDSNIADALDTAITAAITYIDSSGIQGAPGFSQAPYVYVPYSSGLIDVTYDDNNTFDLTKVNFIATNAGGRFIDIYARDYEDTQSYQFINILTSVGSPIAIRADILSNPSGPKGKTKFSLNFSDADAYVISLYGPGLQASNPAFDWNTEGARLIKPTILTLTFNVAGPIITLITGFETENKAGFELLAELGFWISNGDTAIDISQSINNNDYPGAVIRLTGEVRRFLQTSPGQAALAKFLAKLGAKGVSAVVKNVTVVLRFIDILNSSFNLGRRIGTVISSPARTDYYAIGRGMLDVQVENISENIKSITAQLYGPITGSEFINNQTSPAYTLTHNYPFSIPEIFEFPQLYFTGEWTIEIKGYDNINASGNLLTTKTDTVLLKPVIYNYNSGALTSDSQKTVKTISLNSDTNSHTMLSVSAGNFIMGSDTGEGYIDEEPEHTVYLDTYYIDKYEVTNSQYCAYLNSALTAGSVACGTDYVTGTGNGQNYYRLTDSYGSRIQWNGSVFYVISGYENHPVVDVTWYGAVAYCNWLSEQAGKEKVYPYISSNDWTYDLTKNGYHLPTEAQWEKAARGPAPDERTYPWGEGISGANANYWGSNDPYESQTRPYNQNGGPTTPVGYYDGSDHGGIFQTIDSPSPFGVYDMAGNVWEWCNDWYSSSYYSASPGSNPEGPGSGSTRVLRGGGWGSIIYYCRSAFRSDDGPWVSGNSSGFRVVR